MIKYFYNLFCDLLDELKNNKKTVVCVLLFFVLGVIAGGILKVELCCYNWLFSTSFFNYFLFFFFYFAIISILTIVFLKSKRLYFLIFLLLFARGFCFCCTLRHVFFTFSFFKSVFIFLMFFVTECLILLQIAQILIYYYKHNILKCYIFNDFNCYLLICCVVFSFILSTLNFVFLHLLFGCV